jgi:hypothetical protein
MAEDLVLHCIQSHESVALHLILQCREGVHGPDKAGSAVPSFLDHVSACRNQRTS